MDGVSDQQDNCPQNANANQADSDQDGTSDACDSTPYSPMTTYYQDADGDTYGDAGQTTEAYSQPGGYVTNADDCDDQNPNITLLIPKETVRLSRQRIPTTVMPMETPTAMQLSLLKRLANLLNMSPTQMIVMIPIRV